MKEFFSKLRDSLAAKMCLWTLILLLGGGGTAFAQSTVKGTVTDEQGNPLVGVTVVVVNTTTRSPYRRARRSTSPTSEW